MKTKVKNPKAFPLNAGNDGSGIDSINEGMTLRDYFAAKYLQANADNETEPFETLAKDAYRMADLMLIERGKEL